MRFRAFAASLSLFLLIYFVNLFLITNHILRTQLEAGKTQAMAEHYHIASMFGRDIEAVASRSDGGHGEIISLLTDYSRYYRANGLSFDIFDDKGTLVRSLFGALAPKSRVLPEAGQRAVSVEKIDGMYYVRVSGEIPGTGRDFFIELLYDISKSIAVWEDIVRVTLVVGILSSALLSMLLQMLLGWVFRPMREVSAASRRIADGEYGMRINVHTGGEAAEMAQDFNRMADTIQENIAALEELSGRRQAFVDNLAHELRTPITSIYGYAEYLLAATQDEEDRLISAQQIMSESKRILSLSERLLYLARLREGKLSLRYHDVGELLDDVRDATRIQRADKDIALNCEAGLPSVYGDGDLLRSLFINLVNNAANASPAAGMVSLRAFTDKGSPVFTVTDGGRGIQSEEIPRLTEPFYRMDKARSRRDGGTGLGLSICAQIAELHGARLAFASVPGLGTEARVTFTSQQSAGDNLETSR